MSKTILGKEANRKNVSADTLKTYIEKLRKMVNCKTVKAVPYDMMVAGKDGKGEGVLRIDVCRQYEFTDVFDELLQVLLPALHEHFGCERILTKAMPVMQQRRLALVLHGFVPSKEPLKGQGGIEYGNYWAHRHHLP